METGIYFFLPSRPSSSSFVRSPPTPDLMLIYSLPREMIKKDYYLKRQLRRTLGLDLKCRSHFCGKWERKEDSKVRSEMKTRMDNNGRIFHYKIRDFAWQEVCRTILKKVALYYYFVKVVTHAMSKFVGYFGVWWIYSSFQVSYNFWRQFFLIRLSEKSFLLGRTPSR